MTSSVAALIDRGRLARTWPFAAIAAAGQISAIWPPGPSNIWLFCVSTALLVLAALLLFVRAPAGFSPLLLPAAVYIVSVTVLLLATSGVGSGFGPLYLMGVVGVALYGSRRDTSIVVALVLLGLLVVSIRGDDAAMATARRLALLAGISCVLSVSIHALRQRLFESKRHTEQLLHQAESINAAAHRLSSLLEPPAIAALGAELAAQTASPPGGSPAAARYLRIDRGTVTVEASFGPRLGEDSWRLDECSLLAGVVHDLRPASRMVGDSRDDGAASTDVVRDVVLVPVAPAGCLHGVLEIVSPKGVLTDDSLERSIALGAPPRACPVQLGRPRAAGAGGPGRRAPTDRPRSPRRSGPRAGLHRQHGPEFVAGQGGRRRPGAVQRRRSGLGRGPPGDHRALVWPRRSRSSVRWPRPPRIWGPASASPCASKWLTTSTLRPT